MFEPNKCNYIIPIPSWPQKPLHTYSIKHITIMSPYQALLTALDTLEPQTPPSPCTLDVQVSQFLLHCNQKDFQHKPVTLLSKISSSLEGGSELGHDTKYHRMGHCQTASPLANNSRMCLRSISCLPRQLQSPNSSW